MAVSILLVGRQHELDRDEQADVCTSFTSTYLLALSDYARAGGEAEAIFDQSNTNGALKNFLQKVEKDNSRAAMLRKWTNGRARFKHSDKLKKVVESRYPCENARWHEAAYRAMVKNTDDRLGWLQLSDGFYSVRELSFFKQTLDTGKLKEKSQLIQLAEQWGRILATGHARALNAFDQEYPSPDRIFIHPGSRDEFKAVVAGLNDGRHDEFCALVRTVACEYADQVKADWRSFRAAFRAD